MSPLRLIWTQLICYPRQIALACIALVITAAVTLTLGQGIRWIVDRGLAADSLNDLKLGLVALMVISLVMALGTFVRFYMMSWLGERVSADLRDQAFRRLIEQDPAYFDDNLSGEIMSRITADTTILQSLIGSSISMALRNSLMSLGGLVMMLATSPRLTGLILITVPIVLAPILILGRRVRRLSRASQDSIANVGQSAGEALQEIKTVQAFGQVARIQARFGNTVEQAFGVARRRIFQRSLLIAAVIILVFSALSIMLWVGGGDVVAGRLSAGELSAFVFYALLVAMGAATLAEVTSEVQRAIGATERLAEFINLRRHHRQGEQPLLEPQGDLNFSNVSFAYPQRPDIQVLQQLNLNLKAGQTTAIVGASGAGKSTLFELILGFRAPQEGQVLLGEQPLQSIQDEQLRRCISVVPQQPSLFSERIFDNIAFAKPDATSEQVEEVARQAGAHDFITRLPQGYDTRVGERGVQLSGGQRQRIAIARALLAQSRWLLLDEATSALDSHSEMHILNTLEQLRTRISCVVIAHRISTIESADQIVVLENGTVADCGRHPELLERCEAYRQLQPNFSG